MSDKIETQDINAVIGWNLKRLRLSKGFSQEATGDIAGVSFQQIQKNEKGINGLSAARLFLLARTFDVSLDEFFHGFSDTPRKAPPHPDKYTLEIVAACLSLPASQRRILSDLVQSMKEAIMKR